MIPWQLAGFLATLALAALVNAYLDTVAPLVGVR